MKAKDQLRYFGLNNLAIENEIRSIEREYEIDLGHQKLAPKIGRASCRERV